MTPYIPWAPPGAFANEPVVVVDVSASGTALVTKVIAWVLTLRDCARVIRQLDAARDAKAVEERAL